MAISFGRALLAGAAGVAQYSEQEQARRQQRLDRVKELQDRLIVESAKSRYAAKFNRYEKDKEVLRSLGTTDPNSEAGQFILATKLGGLDPDSAVASIRSGARYSAPTLGKEPTFSMPRFSDTRRASSPIEDWVRGYTNGEVGPQKVSYQDFMKEQTDKFQEVQLPGMEDERPPQAPSPELQALADGKVDGGAEPLGTMPTEEQGELQQLGGQQPMTMSAFMKPSKPPKMEVTKQDSIRDGKKGTLVSFTDPQTLETKSTFIPTDMAGTVRLESIKQQRQDGSEIITERFLDPTTNDILTGDQFMTKSADPEAPVEPVKLIDIKEYMRKGKDDQPDGQFYSDFPEGERDKWNTIGEDEGWFWFDKTPEGFEGAIAGAYMDSKNASIRKFKGKHVANPNFMTEMRDVWKATAYLKVLGADGVAEAIEKGAIEPEVFFGNRLNRLPAIQQVQRKLGITKMQDPEKYEQYSKPKYSF